MNPAPDLRGPRPATAAADAISVLLIEDDLVDEMATLRTVLREALPYRMQVARSVAQARALLAVQAFDVILADYQLADGNSFDLMEVFADQVVVFITAAWDEAGAARALRLGVHDYLIKDADGKYLKLLGYRVETALRQRRTECRLRDSEARLQAILNNAPAAISARDLSGRLILSNRHHDELVAARTESPAAAAPDEACAETIETEEALTHRDGSERTYLTVRFPIPDAAGRRDAVGTISVDITARKRAEQQIRTLAYVDPLTGLPNRRMLLDRLQQALATSARHGGYGAVFFIDLDHFKALNDSLGHDHGDMLLVEVGRRLLACVRGEDTVARIGGDEFVVMIASLDSSARGAAAQAASVGRKLLAAISEPCRLGEHGHRVTPSIGVSLFHGRDVSIDEVLKRADVAMYQSKSAGRGTLRFFDPVMQASLVARVALEKDLRSAVGEGQLCLHFQGQYESGAGAVGAEALLRWHHPTRGLLLPDEFLPLAEQNGLILPIGQWVLETACAQLRRWSTDPLARDFHIAVNVSARQFHHEGFAARVEQALRTHGADPARLRLELRESLIQSQPAQTLARMQVLKAIGVSFAMDDFGISLSSLSILKRLPLDQIKISRSLMTNLTNDLHDAAVVKTIVGISRELGLSTIASGVETQAQRDCLHALGCTLCQGFLFGQPATAADFVTQVDTASSCALRPSMATV